MFICILKYKKTKRFSVVNCLERSQSQCISVDPVSVMYVCLTTLGKKKICHWMGFQSTKNAGFPISTTDCTYAFCTSGIFLYWRLKDTTKKNLRKKKSVWPGGVARPRLVPEFDF